MLSYCTKSRADGNREVTLDDEHRRELHASGLFDETIEMAGFYSTDAAGAAKVMGWQKPKWEGRYLVIPCPDVTGRVSAERYRIKPPPAEGRAKYLQQSGVSPFACFTPARELDDIIVIVEGEKKAWSLWQFGYWAIALTGVWNGLEKRNSERHLIGDLRDVKWGGRPVIICFDTDSYAKAGVLHAAAEMARVLRNDNGAQVHTLWLPTGPCGDDGMPSKMAVDDFLAARGPGPLRELIQNAIDGPSVLDLSDYRAAMTAGRKTDSTSIVCLDRSGVGCGKTFADIEMIRLADDPSLLVTPSHRQCDEVLSAMEDVGLDVAKYPILTDKGPSPTCENYGDASSAMSVGLSPSQAVCPRCECRVGCEYHVQLDRAKTSRHSVCTHARAQMSLSEMANGKRLISVQEDAANVLSHAVSTSASFDAIAALANDLYRATVPYGDGVRSDENWYWFKLRENATTIGDLLEPESEYEGPVDLPTGVDAPIGIQAALWRLAMQSGNPPHAETTKIAMAMTEGRLRELAVHTITTRNTKGPSKGQEHRTRVVTAVFQNCLPKNAKVLLGDATATVAQVERMVGRPVVDITPASRVASQKPIVQVPVDVKQSTSSARALDVLRSLIAMRPEATRIGVITHQKFVAHIHGDKSVEPSLESPLRRRIAKGAWFWGCESRGSNAWMSECDLLIVLGTPRPSESMVAERLIQLGLSHALTADPHWMGKSGHKNDYAWHWSATTKSGRLRTIRSVSFGDHRWREAYESICKAELTQSVGRARAILESGIECIVASSDEIEGAVCTDVDPPMFTTGHWQRFTWLSTVPIGTGCQLAAVATTERRSSGSSITRWINWMIGQGHIESPKRGRYRVTSLGRSLIE